MLHRYCMHIENELVEIVTIDDHEFKEIVEEYEEEILVQEEVPVLLLLKIRDYYYSHNKMMKGKMETW